MAAGRFGVACLCLLAVLASVNAQSRPSTSTNVVGSSVLFNNTVPTPAQTLQLYPNFLFNYSYCGTPTNLYAQTARIPVPINGGNSSRTVQGVHIWSVTYQNGNTDIPSSSSARLYLLNDNIFFNLEDGTISVGEPAYYLTAARSSVMLTTPPGGVFQLSPPVVPFASLNTSSGITAGEFTTLVPPFLDFFGDSNGNDELYEQYMARIWYFISTIGLGNNNCSTGYPDLAGYSNYLENVLKNITTGYYDGINEDYNFLTTPQVNASCLTESATSYIGNTLVQGANNILNTTADCCVACHNYMKNATNPQNRCNSYLFCESQSACPLSSGSSATIPAGGCQLQYSDAVANFVPAPYMGRNLGGGIVSGRLTAVKPANETFMAGFDVPAGTMGDNIYSDAVAPSGQVMLQPAGRKLMAIDC